MSKLSGLELRSLNDISNSLSNIAQSYNDNQDSIRDFVHNQINITTDEPEVLKQAKAHFEIMLSNLEDVQSEFKLLTEHFTQKSR